MTSGNLSTVPIRVFTDFGSRSEAETTVTADNEPSQLYAEPQRIAG